MKLTAEFATQFAEIALGHVTREYPNVIQHVLADASDARTPRQLHPIFFGSFDWHSCVHGYWTLARCLRRYPDAPFAAEATALLNASFTAENVAGERAYFERPLSQTFERPYGWAWLLMLQAELRRHITPKGRRWAQTLQPLADTIAERFMGYFPLTTYPVRTGVHSSSAFAVALVLEYAEEVGDERLHTLAGGKLYAWHGAETDCRGLEPSQEDFLSPTLMVAEAMRRVRSPKPYREWLAAYLPRLAQREPRTLFEPALPTARADGKIAHLDGLNLSRAWCWRGIARATEGAVSEIAHDAADLHFKRAMPHIRGAYAGEHWLQSFALLAMEA